MDKITILIEIVVSFVLAFVVGAIFWVIGATYGGNNPVPTFLGLRGYEGAGLFGVMLGSPLGGIIGAYLVRKLRSASPQKMSSALWIGFLVGLVLFLLPFITGGP